MPTVSISFQNAEAGTPAASIFSTIQIALTFESFEDYLNACLHNIVTNVAGLSDVQKIAIKAAAKSMPQTGSADNLEAFLRFTLYGDFASANLSEASDAGLSADQRAAILAQIYATAADIVTARAASLATLAGWTYTAPEWQITGAA